MTAPCLPWKLQVAASHHSHRLMVNTSAGSPSYYRSCGHQSCCGSIVCSTNESATVSLAKSANPIVFRHCIAIDDSNS